MDVKRRKDGLPGPPCAGRVSTGHSGHPRPSSENRPAPCSPSRVQFPQLSCLLRPPLQGAPPGSGDTNPAALRARPGLLLSLRLRLSSLSSLASPPDTLAPVPSSGVLSSRKLGGAGHLSPSPLCPHSVWGISILAPVTLPGNDLFWVLLPQECPRTQQGFWDTAAAQSMSVVLSQSEEGLDVCA